MKFAPLTVADDVFVNVTVKLDVPPGGIVLGANDFEILTDEMGSMI